MATPRKRPWFQFSLATAIVLVIEAGFLLWLNMRPDRHTLYVAAWGWPTTARYISGCDFCNDVEHHTKWPFLLANIAVALGILFVTGAGCEMIVRRRDRTASDNEKPPAG